MLITGGAGFVGANLAIYFKRDNPSWDITSLDNLHRRGSELNLTQLAKSGIKFVHGDIRIVDDLENAGEFDLFVECSAEPSVLAGYDGSPSYLYQSNLVGTLNCLEMCRKRQADIIFLSTSRIYPMQVIDALQFIEEKTRFKLASDQKMPGVSEYGFSEKLPLAGIRSHYGTTKLCSELVIQEYMAAYGIQGVINRCGVITGPWQMGKVDQGFVVLWLARHMWNGNLSYIGYGGKGKQVRDILHIEDLYNLLRMQIDQLDEISGSVYNVGGGPELSISLYELTQICRDLTGHKIPIDSVFETRQADIPYYISDCREIRKITGWKPRKGIKEITHHIHTWLKRNEALLKLILS